MSARVCVVVEAPQPRPKGDATRQQVFDAQPETVSMSKAMNSFATTNSPLRRWAFLALLCRFWSSGASIGEGRLATLGVAKDGVPAPGRAILRTCRRMNRLRPS